MKISVKSNVLSSAQIGDYVLSDEAMKVLKTKLIGSNVFVKESSNLNNLIGTVESILEDNLVIDVLESKRDLIGLLQSMSISPSISMVGTANKINVESVETVKVIITEG